MLPFALTGTTLTLLAAPGIIKRRAADWQPSTAARVHSASMLSGYAILEAGLLICAAPLAASVLGLHPFGRLGADHFFPGGQLAGWFALILAVSVPLIFVLEAVKHRLNRQQICSAALFTADRIPGMDVPIVLLPGDEPVAIAIPGRNPVVVISTSMYEALDADELRLVVRHELAHIRLHSHFLLLIGAATPIAAFVPFVRRSLETLRFTLERWADESAVQTSADRSAMRETLLRHGLNEQQANNQSFLAAGRIDSRTSSLGTPPITKQPGFALGVVVLVALTITAAMTLGMWLAQTSHWPWIPQ